MVLIEQTVTDPTLAALSAEYATDLGIEYHRLSGKGYMLQARDVEDDTAEWITIAGVEANGDVYVTPAARHLL